MKTTLCRFISARAIIASSLLAAFASLSSAQTIATPDGYAGYAGTTGGGNASPITVSTVAAFQSAVSHNNPAVIIVNGMLNVGTISIGSNKTIVGANTNSGLYGGVVQVRGTNYIFQNLNFGPSGSDAMEVSGGSKVFIHKCSFRDSSDELCSIVRQADFVTISWSKFHFDDPDSHSFGHLIGNGDGVTADRGKLHVTLHHNWYGPGLEGRIPRVRFGHVHMYNNYINAVGTGYCIGVGVECNIRVENTHFDGVNNCWADYGGTSNGRLGWAGLKFTNGSTQPTFMPNTFPVFTPPYAFTLDPVDNVRSLVLAGAGNVFGGGGNNAPSVSVTAPGNGASFTVPTSIVINASATDSDGTISSVAFYHGATLLGTDTTAPYSFTWNNVAAGTYSLTARATDNGGATTTSAAVSVNVNPTSNNPPTVSITAPAGGATFTAPASITINANAADSNGTVSSVAFYQGSTLLGTDTTAPYSFAWTNVAAGSYSLTARATDNGGAITTSSAVNITVGSGSGALPSPWQSSDIGAVAAVGTASHTSGVFTIEGSGADIWGTADEFRYVYQAANGDCEIRARITSVENTRADAKVGVMIRESLAANSRHAMVVVTPSVGIHFQRRASTGSSSTSTSASSTLTAPRWLRVVRSGNTFTAYQSADGAAWTTIGSQTITMGANVYIGLAVTSHVDGTLCTGVFSNVTATP